MGKKKCHLKIFGKEAALFFSALCDSFKVFNVGRVIIILLPNYLKKSARRDILKMGYLVSLRRC